MVKRFEVYLVNLDAEISKDPKNTRPGVVISPDEMNRNLSTAIIAPLSSATAKLPTRVQTEFLNSQRLVVLDQLRTLDQNRLVKKIGEIDNETKNSITDRMLEMFAD